MTTPTDWRALCAELLEAYEWCIDEYMTAPASEDALVQRARAALAQPEPQGPTDEEIRDLWSWAAGQDQGPWPTQQHCFARAVLTRWGRPAIQLVPVSERLPGAEDCDADGRCWWGVPAETVDPDDERVSAAGWALVGVMPDATHWLPWHALPVPEVR
jgi:hypothetical protein